MEVADKVSIEFLGKALMSSALESWGDNIDFLEKSVSGEAINSWEGSDAFLCPRPCFELMDSESSSEDMLRILEVFGYIRTLSDDLFLDDNGYFGTWSDADLLEVFDHRVWLRNNINAYKKGSIFIAWLSSDVKTIYLEIDGAGIVYDGYYDADMFVFSSENIGALSNEGDMVVVDSPNGEQRLIKKESFSLLIEDTKGCEYLGFKDVFPEIMKGGKAYPSYWDKDHEFLVFDSESMDIVKSVNGEIVEWGFNRQDISQNVWSMK